MTYNAPLLFKEFFSFGFILLFKRNNQSCLCLEIKLQRVMNSSDFVMKEKMITICPNLSLFFAKSYLTGTVSTVVFQRAFLWNKKLLPGRAFLFVSFNLLRQFGGTFFIRVSLLQEQKVLGKSYAGLSFSLYLRP